LILKVLSCTKTVQIPCDGTHLRRQKKAAHKLAAETPAREFNRLEL
jgi:hypothetical protein